jgi:hypothetical protein
MNRSTFIVGAAALITAVFVAITITFRGPATQVASSLGTPSGQPVPKADFHRNPTAFAAERPSSLDSIRAQARSRPENAAPFRPNSGISSRPGEAVSVSINPKLLAEATPEQRKQLIRVAKEIQNQAAGELQMLTEQFDLTEQQQAKIFPLLVQAAPGFGPGIDIGGINLIDGIDSATGSPVDGSEILETPDAVEDAIFNELDPEQQDDMIEVAIDNQSWWSEIVDQLENDLDAAIGEPVVAALLEGEGASEEESSVRSTTEPIPYDASGQPIDTSEPEAHQGGNVFDLIND